MATKDQLIEAQFSLILLLPYRLISGWTHRGYFNCLGGDEAQNSNDTAVYTTFK